MRLLVLGVLTVAAVTAVAAAENGGGGEPGPVAQFVDLLQAGGATVAVLLALSVLALSSGIERLIHLTRRVVVPEGEGARLTELVAAGRLDEALAASRDGRSTLHRIAALAIEQRDQSRGDINTMCADIARWELRAHLQRCYPLAVVATIAPLLGLFGTVYGMIGAFGTVAALGDMGNPALLADDIAKALITTAVGLAVAIPALGLHHWFRHRINGYANLLEEEATLFIAALCKAPAARAAGAGDAD